MRLHDIPGKDLIRPHPAIIRPLRPRKPGFRPPKRMQIPIQQRILLFHAEPRVQLFRFVHGVHAGVAMVGFRGFLVVLVSLAEDELVVALEKWVLVQGDRVEIHVGI